MASACWLAVAIALLPLTADACNSPVVTVALGVATLLRLKPTRVARMLSARYGCSRVSSEGLTRAAWMKAG